MCPLFVGFYFAPGHGFFKDLPNSSAGKASICNAGESGSIPGLGR